MDQSRTVKAGLSLLSPYLHRSDQRAAGSADRYIANSTSVAQRIKATYDVDAPIVYPPVTMDPQAPQEPVEGLEPGFFLTVSRRRGYKNASVASEAVEAVPGARLVVVGGLPPHPSGRAWSPSVIQASEVTDAKLRWLYANCEALIAPSFEDFGLTPVEAAVFGKPTIALRAGGYLDTVIDGLTGTFFDAPTADCVANGVEELLRGRFNPDVLKTHGAMFGLPRFIAQMQHHVADVFES